MTCFVSLPARRLKVMVAIVDTGATCREFGVATVARKCIRSSCLVEDVTVGYIQNGFVSHLRNFEDTFVVMPDKNEKSPLHTSLTTPGDRTIAVGDVIKCLGGLIPGIRHELYPVIPSFGMPAYFSLERANCPYFGMKLYGVHVNRYVERGGETFLWIGKRSETKSTFPGMLDHLEPYLNPDQAGYLELLRSLRSGDCS